MDEAETRLLSCGVVVISDEGQLLLCHVTGQAHWDLPKGGIGDGETPIQAALRETREETGLLLDAGDVVDLGRIEYRAKKDLHLFATLLPRVDPSRLWCESRFADASGARLPEMDGYGWFAFSDVPLLCTRKLVLVLQQTLDLGAIEARLRARHVGGLPPVRLTAPPLDTLFAQPPHRAPARPAAARLHRRPSQRGSAAPGARRWFGTAPPRTA